MRITGGKIKHGRVVGTISPRLAVGGTKKATAVANVVKLALSARLSP
jgi:hypothetical protein